MALKIRKFDSATPGGVGTIMRIADAEEEGGLQMISVLVDMIVDLVEEPADREEARAAVLEMSLDELTSFFTSALGTK